MLKVPITALKKMTVKEIKDQMPFEITADGLDIGWFSSGPYLTKNPPPDEGMVRVRPGAVIGQQKTRTKCPNCKFEYLVTPPDGKPPFFTMRHPPE